MVSRLAFQKLTGRRISADRTRLIFLVNCAVPRLATLFNSLVDPLSILISVPMSLADAPMFINVGVGGPASISIPRLASSP